MGARASIYGLDISDENSAAKRPKFMQFVEEEAVRNLGFKPLHLIGVPLRVRRNQRLVGSLP